VSPAAPSFPTLPPPAPPPSGGAGSTLPSGGAGSPPPNAIAQVENRWQPADAGVRLGAPEPLTGDAGKAPEIGKAPDAAKAPDVGKTPEVGKALPQLYPPDKTPEPPLNQPATGLPVGIPQFAQAMDNVATGLRPSLEEGLDWLQARRYKTVLQIKLPDEDDSADRKQVEKRGMKYLSLEVSPRTLTKAKLDEFKSIVRDAAGQPLFVYDRDGSLAGGLWYLYFRLVEQFSDDVARVRAGALGLREDRDGAHRDMWLAVQKFLEEQAR
jgi:protein tyrosine phosphatase (PTP) superfamily phosphohydrolase (DUF442 family)